MQFLPPPPIHIVLYFFMKKAPKNRYTAKRPTHFSKMPVGPKFKKKNRNLKILKFSMPKKITPKSQAKIKPPFPQIYDFTNIRLFHKYTILNLNRIYKGI